jgi:hypothetical protein
MLIREMKLPRYKFAGGAMRNFDRNENISLEKCGGSGAEIIITVPDH